MATATAAAVVMAVVALAAPAVAAPAKKAAVDIDALMAQFARAPGLSARFREEKHIALLDAPVVNEGTIHFMPPGRFVRHTEKPLASTLLIDGGRLQFGDADGDKQSLDLGTNPVAKLFVDSFVMIISGDRKGLERVFTLSLSPAAGAGGAWRLVLTPRVSPMDKVLKSITLSGAGLALRDLEVRESSGDWSRTTFADVDVNHRYDAAEAARVFKVPAR
ncbi:MAG TPA: outer membrane lipoprotein carrier protein LolA [Polyangia bacterium]|nr:outer membrane lipoprotein carrier protein LolA [Polyangia bacterium]